MEFSLRLKDYAGDRTYDSIEALTKTLTTLINHAKEGEEFEFKVFNIKNEGLAAGEDVIGTKERAKITGTLRPLPKVSLHTDKMTYDKGKEMITQVLSDIDWVSRAEIAKLTGLANRTLSRYLLKMREEVVVEFQHKGNMYRLIEPVKVKKPEPKKESDTIKMTYEKGKAMIKNVIEEKEGKASRAEIFSITGMASRTLSRYLIKMVDENEINAQGNNVYTTDTKSVPRMNYEKGKERILEVLDENMLLGMVEIQKKTNIAISPLTKYLSKMRLDQIIYYDADERKYRKFRK